MIRERLLQYLEYKRVSKYKFYQITGLSNGFLDKKGAIGSDKCELILSYFPDLNPEWFLLGKGDMLRSLEPKQEERSDCTEVLKDKNRIIELLEADNERLKNELNQVKSNQQKTTKTN